VTAKFVRALVEEVMAPVIDQSIAGAGFRFLRQGQRFVRNELGVEQTIFLGLDATSRYAPGSLAVLYPQRDLSFDATAALLEHEGVGGSGGHSQAVAYGGTTKQWEIPRESATRRVAEDLARELVQRTVPLLDDLRSPDDLIRAYAAGDQRIFWSEGTYAAVVAAYAIGGDIEAARGVARRRWRGDAFWTYYPKVAALLTD